MVSRVHLPVSEHKSNSGHAVLQFTDRQRLLEDILGFLKDVEI